MFKNRLLLITFSATLIFSTEVSAATYSCTLKLAPGNFKVTFSKGKMGKGPAKIVSNGVSYKAGNGKWYTLTSTGDVVHAKNSRKRGGTHRCNLDKVHKAVTGS